MENTQQQGNTTREMQAKQIDAKKAWMQPSITEIPKFAILGGVQGGKNEGPTLIGSA
jgi:hypothetical protein